MAAVSRGDGQDLPRRRHRLPRHPPGDRPHPGRRHRRPEAEVARPSSPKARIVAYAVTEPEAGSNLSNLKTTAAPVVDEQGAVTGYRINGTKQFISNGGYADFLTVLAQAPEGPSFFIVEKTHGGLLAPANPRQKHGIRSSNTVRSHLRRRVRAGGEPCGRSPRAGSRPGQRGLRLHPPHGRGSRLWGPAWRRSRRSSPTPRSACSSAPRSSRSRATRTS